MDDRNGGACQSPGGNRGSGEEDIAVVDSNAEGQGHLIPSKVAWHSDEALLHPVAEELPSGDAVVIDRKVIVFGKCLGKAVEDSVEIPAQSPTWPPDPAGVRANSHRASDGSVAPDARAFVSTQTLS